MRKASSATVAMIIGVALYFTLFWGFDALRMLTSPTYGLEDVWRSQTVFGIGSVFHLSPHRPDQARRLLRHGQARGRRDLRDSHRAIACAASPAARRPPKCSKAA